MIVTYLRSSSYAQHSMCEQSYFITYNLGWNGPPGIKAEKGTIVHKALEILAHIKLVQQNKKKIYKDDILGRIHVEKYDLDDIIEKCYEYYKSHSVHEWKPLDLKHCKKWTYSALEFNGGEYDPRNCEIVQPEQAFDIEIKEPWAFYSYDLPDGTKLEGNLSLKGTIDQISKLDDETYQILDWKGLPIETPIPTPTGWTTMGDLSVGDTVIDRHGKPTKVLGKSKQKWKPCYRITFDDGCEVECDDEHLWILYDDSVVPIKKLKVGDKIPKLNIGYRVISNIEEIEFKVTQCIMVDSPTSTYLCTKNMIPTHNTGRRLNWATGEEKTYEKLCKDPQLMLYYYAIQALYPEIDHFELVIYFINDGGPFRIFFSKDDLPEIESIIRKKFEAIRDKQVPSLNKSWKCTKFCYFGRNTFKGTSIKPIIEQRNGQVTPKGKPMTICEQTAFTLANRPVEKVVENMKKPDFSVDYYQAPGGVE